MKVISGKFKFNKVKLINLFFSDSCSSSDEDTKKNKWFNIW